MRSVAVMHETQVAEARRAAVGRARDLGFDETDAGRVAIVATEMATNLIKHAGGGEILVSDFEDRSGSGVQCVALDRGAGIANLPLALTDGHSTSGSPGTGLGAIMRSAHYAEFDTRPGGTAVLARMMKGRPDGRARVGAGDFGAVQVAKAGEAVCGDAWHVRSAQGRATLVVADGLGHGPLAAQASAAAIGVVLGHDPLPPEGLLARMHLALRPTRGAAVSIARIDFEAQAVAFAGIGNVAGVIVERTRTQRMLCYNGTVGHVARTIRQVSYPYGDGALVVLASDGLGTGWALEKYPGLAQRHPALIAAVLYRDFSRGRDDVTVVVARGSPSW